jgi:glycosyltransferase involved in cell wall biosynthesis
VYNGEKYLSEAIESILAQTFTDFELIVINDGSTDGTLKILREYELRDSRLRLISRENRGLVSTLNEGIGLARGKWIARMDADDISHPSRFEMQIDFLKRNTSVGVLGTWVEFFGESQKPAIWKTPSKHENCIKRLIFSSPIAHPSVMFSRDLLDKGLLRYEKNPTNLEDLNLWMKLARNTLICNLPFVLLKYRVHAKSITRIQDSKDNLGKRYADIKTLYVKYHLHFQLRLSNELLEVHYTISQNNRRTHKKYGAYVLLRYFFTLAYFTRDFYISGYAFKRITNYLLRGS